ncbi:MAG: ZIP family metal transporter [Thermoproteota archaeon]
MDILARLTDAVARLSGGSPLAAAVLVSLYAAAMTALGGFLAVFARGSRASSSRMERLLDVGMGFSSGVMIVASFLSLLIPAMDLAGLPVPLASFVLGAATISLVNELLPHEHIVKGYEGPEHLKRKIRAAWLVAVAIIIHNLPEGMAIGASTAYNVSEGVVVGIAIGTQDFPEGLAVSLPVYASTGSLALAIAVAALSGLSEVVTSALAAFVAGASSAVLAGALAFASGAMVYVVSHEALPESHRSGHEKPATLGFFAGFIVMLALDAGLG